MMGRKDAQGCPSAVTPGSVPLGAGMFWRGAGGLWGAGGRQWGGGFAPALLRGLHQCCDGRAGVPESTPLLSLRGGSGLGFVTAEPCLCPGRGHRQVPAVPGVGTPHSRPEPWNGGAVPGGRTGISAAPPAWRGGSAWGSAPDLHHFLGLGTLHLQWPLALRPTAHPPPGAALGGARGGPSIVGCPAPGG